MPSQSVQATLQTFESAFWRVMHIPNWLMAIITPSLELFGLWTYSLELFPKSCFDSFYLNPTVNISKAYVGYCYDRFVVILYILPPHNRTLLSLSHWENSFVFGWFYSLRCFRALLILRASNKKKFFFDTLNFKHNLNRFSAFPSLPILASMMTVSVTKANERDVQYCECDWERITDCVWCVCL